MKKITAKALAVLMACTMIPATLPIVSNAEVNDVIDGTSAVLYSHDASDRPMESLNRGLVVQALNGGNYLSWRLMVDEDEVYGTSESNVPFNIYKNGQFLATETYSTNYIDPNGTSSDTYQVAPIVNGVEGEKSDSVAPFASGSNYFDIPVDKPKSTLTTTTTITTDEDGNELPENQWYTEKKVNEYTIGDTSCGDLDGDGEYELVVKWDCAPRDNSQAGLTGNVYLDAYKLNGKKLWRIDLGKNIRAGAHYTQFLVYDFDMDGKAEVACKTAPGSIDGVGKYVSETSSVDEIRNANDKTVSYVNQNGYILDGNEYFTAFDGETGKTIDTIYYPIPRLDYESWGDTNGNRCDRYVASVAWLDGQRPYAVYWRGYYMGRNGRQRHGTCGISLENGVLNPKYKFDTYSEDTDAYTPGNEKYVGEGNHNMTVADVDDDGNDEFISATLCYEVNDEDKLMPKWYGGRQHGDALHIGNYDPTNNNFEYFSVHEHGDFGMTLMDAKTGEEAFHVSDSNDTGRGLMANIGMGGYYQMSSNAGTYVAYGNNVFKKVNASMGQNFRIFWDGDLYDEELDGLTITSWNGAGRSTIFKADGCTSINSTKANPALQADIFGDWREEVIYPLTTNDALRVYTTNIPSEYKIKSLMFDSVYRSGVASEQSAYNQPPHVSMYMSEAVMRGNVTNISIEHEPTKKNYIKGEQLDTTGLKLIATYENGRVSELTYYETNGYDPSKLGEQTVTVSSGNASASFKVNVTNGTTYYSDNFQDNDLSDITISRQDKADQSKKLDGLDLNIGSKSSGGDKTSGYFLGNRNGKSFLACFAGNTSSASRGASIKFNEESYVPKFTELADNEKIVLNFDAYYHSEKDTMQIYGVTNSTNGASNKLIYDPYLSYQNNNSIPLNEWFNVNIEISKYDSTNKNAKNATITMTDLDGNQLYTNSFRTVGQYIDKFAFYVPDVQVDIGYMSLSTTTLFDSIDITTEPTKTSYTYGDDLDLSGMVVKAYYSDNTSKTITDYTVSGYDPTKVGKQTVTVHYLDMTDTFEVTVAEGELSSIEIASNPSKTTYFTGEQLDTSGLSVKLNYANGSSKTITDGFDVSGFDNQTVGTNTLTVSYGGKTTTFTVTIVSSELTSYVNDDFESYDDSQITIKSQTLTEQNQDLGPFKLTLGTNKQKLDSDPHFAILTDNGNKSLEIATGGSANPERGPKITLGDSVTLPEFANIPANKYLVFDFDALYQNDTSNVQLCGVTDSYLSTAFNKLTYDQYLSVNKNANIPVGEWVNIHLAVNNKKDLFLTISDKSGNVLNSRKVTTSGDKFEKFVFYGGVGKIQLDNLKIYEDKISSMTLTPPTKTSYALGEELNLDGMVAKLNYSDKSVGTTAYTVSGYDKTKVGMQTVTVSYGDYSANFDVTVNGISSIKVTPPTKTTYLEGQDLNTDGMVVTAVTTDNQRITVPDGYSVRGFNKTKLGKQTITVTYQGLSTEFEVNVISVKSIELTKPTKLEYKYGESLDTSGMSVKAIYDDNQSEVIKSGYSVTGYDKTKSGTQTITVTYRNQTATFDVTVAEPQITKIEITTPPTTTEYYVGQDLKTDGMVVTVTFEDESTQTTTAYTLSGYDKKTVGTQTVTVRYKGFSDTFDVTVKEAEAVSISGVTVEDKTYDGKPIEYSGTPTSDNYSGDYEYIWETADGTVLDSAPINAGNYKLVVKVSDETFAHTGSVEIPFTINKAALTITAENKSIAFGMNAPEFTCKADGLVDGDTLSATYSCDYTVESPIGDYAIIPTDCTFTSGSKDNYDITYVNGTLTIKEAQKVDISGVTVESKTYDGVAVQYSGTAESADYDGEFDYIWQTDSGTVLDSAPINAGNYKLVVKVPSDNLEYVGSTEVSFTINKANLTITAANMSTNVNSVVPAYKFTSSGLVGDDALDTIFSCEYTKDSDVGTYVITPTDCTFTSGVKNNYNIEYVNGTLSIYGSSYNKTSKTVKIYSKYDTDIDCYIVSYAENGTLDGIKKEHCSLKADKISTIDISSLKISENDSIKIFLWDNNLTPVEITN